jgi:hypothetical protein
VDRFNFVEVTLRHDQVPAENPFTQCELTGECAVAGSAPWKVEGFCDAADGRLFKIRFMPMVAGPHQFSVRFKGPTSDLQHSGEFLANEGDRPGLLRVDAEHPTHFIFAGSRQHFFWNSTTTYWLLGLRDDRLIQDSLGRLAGLGINRIRVALSGRTRDGMRWREPEVVPSPEFAFRLAPWPASSPDDITQPGYDVTRFDVQHFQKAERMLKYAGDLGIQVSLIFHLDGADPGVDPFGKARMGGPDEQRYYRYCVARFAPFANVMWDITNEWHLFRNEAWVNQMGQLVKDADPYDHLTSVHGTDFFPFRTAPWVDYVMFQSWDEHGGYQFMLRNRQEQAAMKRPLPTINEEYGYEDHYPFPWGEARRWPARTADTRRRLAWEMTMAGGYQTTGERANVPGRGGWINGRGNDRMTMLVGYGYLRRFFESFPWWQLEPRPDLLQLTPEPPLPDGAEPPRGSSPIPVLHGQPMCLAQLGKRYVVYLPRGGPVTVTLEPGNYAVRWYNPRIGRYVERVEQSAGGCWSSPSAPDAEDWVLLVESSRGE